LSFLKKLFGFRKGEDSEVSQVGFSRRDEASSAPSREERKLVLPKVFRPRWMERASGVRLVQGRVVGKANPMVTVESEVCARCEAAGQLRLVARALGKPWLCLFSCEQPCNVLVKVDLSSVKGKS